MTETDRGEVVGSSPQPAQRDAPKPHHAEASSRSRSGTHSARHHSGRIASTPKPTSQSGPQKDYTPRSAQHSARGDALVPDGLGCDLGTSSGGAEPVELPSPMSPQVIGPDPLLLARMNSRTPRNDGAGASAPTSQPAPSQSSGCTRPACGKMKSKLKQAVEANANWQRHCKKLEEELAKCRREQEQGRTRQLIEQYGADASKADHAASRKLEAAKEANHDLKAQIKALESELAKCRAEQAQQSVKESLRAEYEARAKLLHTTLMDRDTELKALKTKVEKTSAELRKRLEENKAFRTAIRHLEEQLVMARNQADSSQRNFITVSRERDVLLGELMSLSGRGAPTFSEDGAGGP